MASRDEVTEAKENVKNFMIGFKEREAIIRSDEKRLEELIRDCEKAEKAAKKEKKVYKDLIAEKRSSARPRNEPEYRSRSRIPCPPLWQGGQMGPGQSRPF